MVHRIRDINKLDALEWLVFTAGMFLCAFVTGKNTCDYTLTTRNLIWLGMTVLLVIVLFVRALKGEGIVHSSYIYPLFVGFILVAAMSITKAILPGESVYEVIRYVVLLILLVCFAPLCRRNSILKSMLLLSLSLSAYGVYVVLSGAPKRGTMANINMFAAAIMLLMSFGFICWKFKRWRPVCVVSITLSLFSLFMLATRASLVSLFVFTIFVIGKNRWIRACKCILFVIKNVIWFCRRIYKSRILCVFLLVYFLYITAWFCLIPGYYCYRWTKNVNLFRTSSMIERKNLWYITLKMGLDNPLGVGIGNWPVCAPKYNRLIEPVIRKNSFIKSYYRRAHDGFLQIFSETGYAGLIFYGSIFTTAIRQAVKNRIILASFLAFTNFNIFSFPTERPFLCLIFVFLLASTMPGNMYPVKKRYLFPVIVLVMLSLSFAGHVFYVRHQTETNLRQFYRLIKHKKWKEAAQRTEHCSWLSKLNFSGDPIPYHYGIALLEQGEIETLIKYGYVPKCVYTNTEKASKAFKQALAVNPYHAFSLVNLGICYVKMEMYGEAKKCYEICKYLYPEYEKPKDELAYLNYVIERMYR